MERRNRKQNSDNDGYNWMNTYGDMVTLLLTFFVLLFSFSTVNEQKWKKLVSAFSGQGGSILPEGGDGIIDISPTPAPSVTYTPPNVTVTPSPNVTGYSPKPTSNPTTHSPYPSGLPHNIDKIYNGMIGFIVDQNLGADVEVIKTDYSVIIRFRDRILFEPGKADLKPEFNEMLDRFSQVLYACDKQIYMVKIEGHTDNSKIENTEFPTCWELSTTRSVNVLKHILGSANFNARKFSAVGYGEFHPIATNLTSEGRSKNRRVDFVIVASEIVQEG